MTQCWTPAERAGGSAPDTLSLSLFLTPSLSLPLSPTPSLADPVLDASRARGRERGVGRWSEHCHHLEVGQIRA